VNTSNVSKLYGNILEKGGRPQPPIRGNPDEPVFVFKRFFLVIINRWEKAGYDGDYDLETVRKPGMQYIQPGR
jgi:hypothetical protein